MKINLYDTTGRWWEMANVKSRTVAELGILWINKEAEMRDFVQVYPIHENGVYYGGNPMYLLCDHIVAYEVIGQEIEDDINR